VPLLWLSVHGMIQAAVQYNGQVSL
jgi:hypothetical protein